MIYLAPASVRSSRALHTDEHGIAEEAAFARDLDADSYDMLALAEE